MSSLEMHESRRRALTLQMNGHSEGSPSPLYSFTLTAMRAGFLIGPTRSVKRASSCGQTRPSCEVKVPNDAFAPRHIKCG